MNWVAKKGGDPKDVRKINLASTDICGLQLNWHWHNEKFQDVVEMTNIDKCVDVAAKYLSSFLKTYKIHDAIGCYHYCKPGSNTHKRYSQKVMAIFEEYNPDYYSRIANVN